MSGVFVEPAMSDDATRRVRPVEKPPTFGEQFGANWRLNQDDDEAVAESNRIRSYNAVEDSLVALGYPRARYNNPAWSTWLVKAERSPQRFDTIWRDLQAARAKSPKHFTDVPKTREDFDRWAYGRRGERVRDQATSEAGNSTTAFLAPMIGSGVLDSLQPENLPAMAMGGGAKTVVGIAARGTLANTIAAVPTAIETAQTRTKMGEDYTANQGITDILTQGLIGGALDVGLHVGARAIPKAVDAVAPGYRAARSLNAETLASASDAAIAAHFDASVPHDLRTPDEKAALHVIGRQAEVDATRPYTDTPTGMDAHADRLQAALDAIMRSGRETGAPAYRQRPLFGVLTDAADRGTASLRPRVPRGNGAASIDGGIVKFFTDKGYSPAQARGIAAGIEAESRSNHGIVNPDSGAMGLGQWLGDRKKKLIAQYGPNPTREQQLEFLHRELHGGDHGGKKVLSAGDEAATLNAYIRHFMRPAAGKETDGDLARGMAALGRERDPLPGGGGETAGVDGEASVRNPDLDAPRPEMVARDDGFDAPEPPQLRRDLFPDDATHAAAQAAHDAEWRGEASVAPVRAMAAEGSRPANISAPVVSTETRASVRRYVMDGKAGSLNPETIAKRLDMSVEQARAAIGVLASEGRDNGLFVTNSGRVLRTPTRRGPVDLLTFLSDRGGLIDNEGHDLVKGRGLQRMMPGTGKLIRKGGLPIDRAGEALYEAGYWPHPDRPTVDDVLQLVEQASRQKVWQMHDLDDVAQIAQAKAIAGQNEEIWSRIGQHLSARGIDFDEAGMARTIDHVLKGESIEDAVVRTVDEDVQDALDAARIEADDGDYDWEAILEDAGRTPAERAAAQSGDGSTPDARDAGQGGAGAGEPDGAARDEQLAADPGYIDPDPAPLSPNAEQAALDVTTESLTHDLRQTLGKGAATDPAIAERQRQQAALKAEAPLRSTAEQDGTMGSPLFDAADQPTFRLDESSGDASFADIEAAIAADEAAAKAARGCL